MSSESNITFQLFAPYNKDVKLLGSWNDWQPLDMTRGDDGVWRAEVSLADGDYKYKFQVISLSWFAEGNAVNVADPGAAEFTLDEWENAIARIRGGKRVITSYDWQHEDLPLPANDQLIIYELHVGDFRGGEGDDWEGKGTFEGLIQKLDYLQELGITAIEVMPLTEWPGDHSWGYSQRSLFAVENSYGTPDDLCRLVDECHARGIRVIHDMVYNHMEADAPLTQIDYTYWFYRDNPDAGSGLDFGPKFDYDKLDENLNVWPARKHVMDSMRYWVDTYRIDGIRFDCTRAIRYYDLLKWFHDEMHARVEDRPFYTIAEHIPQDPTIAGPDGPMDAAWHDNFFRQISATILGVEHHGRDPFNTEELLRLMDGRRDGFSGPFNTVHYHENHDEDHAMYLLGAKANTFGEAAFRRLKMGASLLLTAPGIPMLWMGQEFGQPTHRNTSRTPAQWNLLNEPLNRGLFEHYKHLINLRKSMPALIGQEYEPVLNIPDRAIIGFKRWNHEGNVVVVVANLKDAFGGDFEVVNAGLEDGVWREVIYGYDVHVQGGRLADRLAESEVKIYIKQ